MRDSGLLGSWVRRFLLEHLIGERNLARNTQHSYRDTLRLLLPFAARRAHKAIDRLKQYGGTVLKTSLSEDVEAQLQAELDPTATKGPFIAAKRSR